MPWNTYTYLISVMAGIVSYEAYVVNDWEFDHDDFEKDGMRAAKGEPDR